MTLLHRFMPAFAVRQIDRVAVAAPPEPAYATARSLDLFRVGFVRWLFELRGLPERVAARARGKPAPRLTTSRIDDFTHTGVGFQILGEDAGREVVVGAIGKVWQPVIEWADVTPDEFAKFEQRGFVKVAWCIRVDPRQAGGSWIGFEVRVDATDEESLARFKRYWWLIGRFSHLIRHEMLRVLERDLGHARDSDDTRALPGDELLPTTDFQRTHTINIEAPPSAVWPWLVQMGCRRAGWYSLDFLDNGGVHSAERIIPELQHVEVGDILPSRPRGADGFAVLRCEPDRTFVLGSPELLPDGGPPQLDVPPWRSTWAFVLEPMGEATRLLVRVRARREENAKARMAATLATAAHEIMERVQLANLKRRAETTR